MVLGEILSIPASIYNLDTNEYVDVALNVGKYQILASGTWSVSGTNNVAENYYVVINDSNVFEITPRIITVNILNQTHIYDGNVYNNYPAGSRNYELASGSKDLIDI